MFHGKNFTILIIKYLTKNSMNSIKTQILIGILTLIPFFSVAQSSFYNYTVSDIDGNEFSFEQLKGKKVMIVNVASKCGFTPQYEQLEAIYSKYRDENFVIIGFPANNFMRQ